jgi:uroporphyrin-III C-methyltransferase
MQPPVTRGRVTLLSAGPGDLDLLTVRAVKALELADVLLLDDLVNPQITTLAPGARVVRIGKRAGRRSTSQEFICMLLRRLALQGQEVVRVKGGDALLFGRAGEEIAYLEGHGIEVRLVNGISSGFAAASALGASLTHRDHCNGVTFVTAHTRCDGEPDWGALAATGTTLVIYMGMTRLDAICRGLLASLPAATPAAVVQAASCEGERQLLTTLGELARSAHAQGFGSPAVVIVGEVLGHARARQAVSTLRGSARYEARELGTAGTAVRAGAQ